MEQLQIPGISRGDEMMQQAREWTVRNREAWWAMCMEATRRAAEGRRFGIAELFEDARWNMRTEGRDGGFKCNNTLRAPLARLMVRQYPQVEPYIEMRKSKADMGR